MPYEPHANLAQPKTTTPTSGGSSTSRYAKPFVLRVFEDGADPSEENGYRAV